MRRFVPYRKRMPRVKVVEADVQPPARAGICQCLLHGAAAAKRPRRVRGFDNMELADAHVRQRL